MSQGGGPEEAGAPQDAGTPDASGPTSNCGDSATALAGASWSVTASRFAFGGTPAQQVDGKYTRWVGTDGQATDIGFGYVMASLNGGATAGDRPDWSADSDAMQAHVKAYMLGFGIPACQVGSLQVNAESGGGGSVSSGGVVTAQPHRIILLNRVVDGIPLIDSKAFAKMNDLDQSTDESFFWPTIPAATITAAKAFRDQLADAGNLAAYKAKLPANARGDGAIVIRHTTGIGATSTTFRADVAWSTTQDESTFYYDPTGTAYPLDAW